MSEHVLPLRITISISTAAALFGMSVPTFTQHYIHTGRLKLDRLHQLDMKIVLRIYKELPIPPRLKYEDS